MRILFINNFLQPDYLNDSVYHGLYCLAKKYPTEYEVSISSKPSYMLDTYPDPHTLYGRGFSLYAFMKDHLPIEDFNEMLGKIRDRYYDVVIYGSITRDPTLITEVFNAYPKDRILLFDGEDHIFADEFFAYKGTYFKRENVHGRSDLRSTNFAIPEEKVFTKTPDKTQVFGTVVPGDSSTYVFDTEKEYYEDYSRSFYGITNKKGGWDCLRHYEIFAAYCIPYFSDIHLCPGQVLTNMPKNLLLEVNRYAVEGLVHPDYDNLLEEAHKYTLKYLTTEALATKILS